MTMRLLITGGSGFIASYVAKLCLELNHSIILQTRNSNLLADMPKGDLVSILNCSFLSLQPESLRHIDCIIHLASAGVSPRYAAWDELDRVNVSGTLSMCQLAKEVNARIVVAGSYAEYGNSALRYEKIPVDSPLEPVYPYAVSKAAACQLALGFARSESIPLAYLRIFNAFGPGQHESNLWPSLIRAAQSGHDFKMTKGEQIRDFVAVEDVAKQIVHAATHLEMHRGAPFVANVASGKPSTLLDFVNFWWKQCRARGKLQVGSVPYRGNEIMRFVPSMQSAYL